MMTHPAPDLPSRERQSPDWHPRKWRSPRLLALQAVLTLIGATAFCVFSRSWADKAHLWYDIPAGLVTFGFVAQLVIEFPHNARSRFWRYRLAALIAMTVITVGRQYADWTISGHLTCVLAVAMIQAQDQRLSRLERIAYCTPISIVLYLRLALLEWGSHTATWNALIAGFFLGAGAIIAARETSDAKKMM